jgi:hypothetical protein
MVRGGDYPETGAQWLVYPQQQREGADLDTPDTEAPAKAP